MNSLYRYFTSGPGCPKLFRKEAELEGSDLGDLEEKESVKGTHVIPVLIPRSLFICIPHFLTNHLTKVVMHINRHLLIIYDTHGIFYILIFFHSSFSSFGQCI